MGKSMRICIVTEELAGTGSYGGIGAAVLELAHLLATQHSVEILYCPEGELQAEAIHQLKRDLDVRHVRLTLLDMDSYVAERLQQHRSYAVMKFFENNAPFDVIHFHDWKGLGFFTQIAKNQGLILQDSTIVVQVHGPTRWTLECNHILPEHPGILRLDHMERVSVRLADIVVCPSRYILDWMIERGVIDSAERCRIIKNPCAAISSLYNCSRRDPWCVTGPADIEEVVFYGRHENRKGFSDFCGALSKLNALLTEKQIAVTFLGPFGTVDGKPSGRVLADRSRKWTFTLNVIPHLDRNGAISYLLDRPDALVVIASPIENSPYTVLEAIALGSPVLTSSLGGAKELIHSDDHDSVLFEPGPAGLARKIREVLETRAVRPRLAESIESVSRQWLDFHKTLTHRNIKAQIKESPKVALGITTYERPDKLFDAVESAIRQTYQNIEIVVVDDGSTSPATIAALSEIENRLKSVGGRLIRQENKYLGAARNAAANSTKSEYLCFLDDDNILFPNAIETLVGVATRTGADVVNCIVLTMSESRRREAIRNMEHFDEKVRWIPMAGPLSMMPIENVIGDATAMIKRATFEKVGGYTELRDVGYEDFEFFCRVMQIGGKMEICPRPLYFYEVDRPSMLSSTNSARNFKRVFDCIDFSKHSGAWRDLISVTTAARSADVHRGYVEHAANTEPLGRELANLLHKSNDHILSVLSDYSEITSSHAAQRAFSNALAIIRRETTFEAIDRDRKFTDIDSNVIAPDDPALLRKIIHEHLPYVGDPLHPITSTAMVFVAALKLKDAVTASSIFLKQLQQDEHEYLSDHPDVPSDALSHFETHGRHENRPGFRRLHILCKSAQSVFGMPVQPWTLELAILDIPKRF
jgi:glycosyltransferase involved in cell wall biosynthesis